MKPSLYAKAVNAAMMAFLGLLSATLVSTGGAAPTVAQWLTIVAGTWISAWTTYQTPNATDAPAGPLPVRIVPQP